MKWEIGCQTSHNWKRNCTSNICHSEFFDKSMWQIRKFEQITIKIIWQQLDNIYLLIMKKLHVLQILWALNWNAYFEYILFNILSWHTQSLYSFVSFTIGSLTKSYAEGHDLLPFLTIGCPHIYWFLVKDHEFHKVHYLSNLKG